MRNLNKDELWDLTLQDAVQIALSHSDIIRSSGQFLSPGNPILSNPEFAPSSYDVAIQETGVLFGQRGVEAALSEFDAQFTTRMTWGRDERIQNNLFSLGLRPGDTLVQETANFDATLQKRLATGGVVGVTHEWDYEWNNVTGQLFPSVYTGRLRTEFRQPLLAGAGTEYTRIAGPITQNIQGVTGVQQGVVIARINNDISVADFEQSVTNLVHDVETLYWQLYLAYQQFDGETTLSQEALRTWRDVNARGEAQATGGGAVEQAESLDLYYQIKARLDFARNNLYEVEAQLRRMMGLVPNDGSVIRPIDEPIIADFRPDWQLMLGDALVHRVELRKQKWNIKRLELELKAAEHLTKPRFDFVSGYQVNAFGDDLLGSQSDGMTSQGLGSAYRTLTGGDQTGWDLGFEFSLPIGLRFARTQVRNMQIRLAKARAGLQAQEIEISHELAAAFRQIDRSYLNMQSSLNRQINAEQRLQAVKALAEAKPQQYTQDTILRAEDQYVQTKSAFLQALVDYNIAVMDIHFRSGSLLGLNNVYLSEGPWVMNARNDAIEKAACRALSIPASPPVMHAEPAPFALPAGTCTISSPPPAAGPALGGWSDELPPFPDTFGQPSTDSPLLQPGPPKDIEPPLLFPPVQPDPPSDVDPYLSHRLPMQPLQTMPRLVSG